MTTCIGVHINLSIHVTHILEGLTEVFAGKAGLKRIEDNWRLADILKRTVKPFRRVTS